MKNKSLLLLGALLLAVTSLSAQSTPPTPAATATMPASMAAAMREQQAYWQASQKFVAANPKAKELQAKLYALNEEFGKLARDYQGKTEVLQLELDELFVAEGTKVSADFAPIVAKKAAQLTARKQALANLQASAAQGNAPIINAKTGAIVTPALPAAPAPKTK